jgi:iron complex outermembrane recepter protein
MHHLHFPTPTNLTGIRLGILAGLFGFCFYTIPVFAQDQEVEKKEDVEELVIVGSRIRQADLKTISPVKTYNREIISDSGLNTPSDLLQGVGVTGGASQINNAYGGFVTEGGPGANTISLRGLGASRTLVLINGRRLAPAGTRGEVTSSDLNVLPTAIVDRIEILKDGASSIYGSDAISGVVNVVTRNDMNGFSIEGDFNDPTEGEGEQTRLSLSGGLTEEDFSISGSFEIYDRKELNLQHRNWARCNQDLIRDPDTGESADFIDPATGKSKCYTISGTGSNGVTINTIGTQSITAANYQALGLTSPVVGAVGSSGTTFTRFRPNTNVTTGLVGFEGVGGGTNNINVRDTFEYDMLRENIISPTTNYTGFIQSRYNLNSLGNAELYTEFLASRRESSQTGYRQLSLDYRRGSPVIPANLAFGNFGADQGTSGGARVGVRAFIGWGNDYSEQNVDYLKPTVGIRGDLEFIPDWRYDAYFSYSKSKGSYLTQSFLIDKLTYASDVVVAPSNLNPALARNGLTCNINLTSPDEKCVPYPMLTAAVIGGDLPADFKDYIFRDVEGTTKFYEAVYNLTLDGPIYTLPAGQVQAALGFEHRKEKINDQPDINSINGNLYNLSSAAVTVGKDNVTEIYGEMEIPILEGMSFAKKLNLNTSVRFTEYDSYGSDTTYKAGLIYAPQEWVSLRATKGTSFRAPALAEQYQGATSGFRSATGDPCNEYGNKTNPILVANCTAELPNQPLFQATSGITVYSVGGAENGLFAETSDNINYGIIFDPVISDSTQMSLTVDYFDIEITDGVAKAGYADILAKCYNDPDFSNDSGFCRLVERDPITHKLFISDAYTNLATQISRGVEANLTVQQDIGPGYVFLDMVVTRYNSQATKLFDEDPLEENNGTIDTPEMGATLALSYTLSNWKVTYGLDWIDGMDSYEITEADPAEFDLEVPSYLEHRLSVRYMGDNWKTTVGVRNLTNETPPEISYGFYNRVGNSSLYSGYDYVGRELFVNFMIDI